MKNFICIAQDNINNCYFAQRVCTNDDTIDSAKKAFWDCYPFESYPVDGIKLLQIICIPDDYRDMYGATTETHEKET